MKTVRAFSIVAAFTLLSNLLGYVRDAALAANFGMSTATDAYFAAFFVPNTLFLILIGGSVSAVFVPVFIECLGNDREEAWYVASCVFNVSALVLGVIVFMTVLTVQKWMALLFPGFGGDTLQLSVELSLLLLPMLLITGLSALLTAALNSFEHFTIPALAPVISNVIVIVAILLSGHLGGIYGVAIGVLIGMLVQLVVQVPMLVRYGALYRPVMNVRHPALRRMEKLALPLVGYLAVAYASVAAERLIASTLPEGTVSALNYAMRLFVLPIALFAGSLGTVIYPRLSLEAGKDDEGGAFAVSLSRATGLTVFVLTPVSLWLIVNSHWVVALLYGRGRFTSEDVRLTALFVSGYSIGMMPTGVAGILQKGLYAMRDTVTPLKIEVGNLVLYIAVASGLASLFGAAGLSVARGLSFIAVAAASILAYRRYKQVVFRSMWSWSVAGRYSVSCVFASLIWVSPLWISQAMDAAMTKELDFLIMTVSTVVGFAAYLGIAHRLGLNEARLAAGSCAALINGVMGLGCRIH